MIKKDILKAENNKCKDKIIFHSSFQQLPSEVQHYNIKVTNQYKIIRTADNKDYESRQSITS